MSEPFEASEPVNPPDLLLSPQEPIVFPNLLLGDRRWQQLPPGNVVYMDASKIDPEKPDNHLPRTVVMLDQQGHPVQLHGHN